MNAGVATDPLRVSNRQSRAPHSGSTAWLVNRMGEDDAVDAPVAIGMSCQSFFNFRLSDVSFSRTSVSDVTPKFLHSRSSSPVCLSRSPTDWMLSLLMHLRARTERFKSPIGLFM